MSITVTDSIPRTLRQKLSESPSVLDFTACRRDVKRVDDAAMTVGSPNLDSATAGFTAGDIGKLCKVKGASTGGYHPHLYSSIVGYVSATRVVLAGNAVRTVTGARAYWGTDNTAPMQAALNQYGTGLHIPAGGYAFLGPLTLRQGCHIRGDVPGTAGELSLYGSLLHNMAEDQPVFQFTTAPGPEVDDGFVFHRLSFASKRGIQINDPYGSMASQAYIVGAVVRDCYAFGDYLGTEDPEAQTSTMPTLTGSANSLDLYGWFFAAGKTLGVSIEHCFIRSYGVPVWWHGCSNSSVSSRTRISLSGVAVWHNCVGFEGNWSAVKDSELLNCYRRGWVWIQMASTGAVAVGFDVRNNAFEQALSHTTSPIGTYIYSESDYGLSVEGNTFLDPYSDGSTQMISLAPAGHLRISGNKLNPGGHTYAPTVEIRKDNWDVSRATAGFCYGNNQVFPALTGNGADAVVMGSQFNPRLFASGNMDNFGGGASTAYPWITSSTTGHRVIQTTTGILICKFRVTDGRTRVWQLRVTGLWTAGPGGTAVYPVVKYTPDGLSQFTMTGSGLVPIIGDAVHETTGGVYVSFPLGTATPGTIEVTLDNRLAEIARVELVPMDTQWTPGRMLFAQADGQVFDGGATGSPVFWDAPNAMLGIRLVPNPSLGYSLDVGGDSHTSGKWILSDGNYYLGVDTTLGAFHDYLLGEGFNGMMVREKAGGAIVAVFDLAGLAAIYGGTGNITYAKGDLLVATGASALARLAVGANGLVLTADSTGGGGVNWLAPASAPVTSVNTHTGAVVLAASDVGADASLSTSGHSIVLAKITTGGANGSLTTDTHGRVTAYTAPT